MRSRQPRPAPRGAEIKTYHNDPRIQKAVDSLLAINIFARTGVVGVAVPYQDVYGVRPRLIFARRMFNRFQENLLGTSEELTPLKKRNPNEKWPTKKL